MKKESYLNLIKAVAFICIGVFLFALVSFSLERKTYAGAWNYMAKMNEFYDLEENSLDYVCVGSSHAYCTVNPLEVYHEAGVKGFVLATQQQPLRASYHYLVEAFKTQSPKLVFLEGYMLPVTEASEGVLYDAIDPLRPSLNKLQMINAIVKEGDREAYYFNVLKYHTRWKELSAADVQSVFTASNDIYKGYVAIDGSYVGKNFIPDYDSVASAEIPEENLEALNDILELVRENGAELVLMIAPYSEESGVAGTMKAGREWATQNGVRILDYSLLLESLGIDPAVDYYDGGHLDLSGAAICSRYLASYLLDSGLEAKEKTDEKWNSDYQKYSEKLN